MKTLSFLVKSDNSSGLLKIASSAEMVAAGWTIKNNEGVRFPVDLDGTCHWYNCTFEGGEDGCHL